MYGSDEVELTEKGRRALENQDLDLPKSLRGPSVKISLLAVLALTRNGFSVSEMVEALMEFSEADIQRADNLVETLVNWLARAGYLRWICIDEGEVPEAFEDFKDHF